MSQDELTKAIINIINKELGVVKEILPKDLLKNVQKVISPELENLIEKSGYVSKSKYKALERLAQELEERIVDLEKKISSESHFKIITIEYNYEVFKWKKT